MQCRLDVFLCDNNIVKSRTLAASLIKDGKVTVNGSLCTKPSVTVSDEDRIELVGEMPKYVGRGGLKLEKALADFAVLLDGLVCMDIGASTGGFTDCMLQNGAEKVYAVDVGTNQLDDKLRCDTRVVSMEQTDIRSVGDDFPTVDFISIDVSFISLKLVLPSAYRLLKSGGSCIALIKPQFEAGKQHLNKKGVVRDEKVRKKICDDISGFAISIGFASGGIVTSSITGGDGNVEYLIYLKKEAETV